jgi:hypothetical protein
MLDVCAALQHTPYGRLWMDLTRLPMGVNQNCLVEAAFVRARCCHSLAHATRVAAHTRSYWDAIVLSVGDWRHHHRVASPVVQGHLLTLPSMAG